MALQLDVKPVAKDRRQPLQQNLRFRPLPSRQKPAERPLRPPGQTNKARVILRQLVQRHLRQRPTPAMTVRADIKRRVQLHQVHVTCLGLHQQHDGRGRAGFLARPSRVMRQTDLAPHDRLQASPQRRDRKLQRGKHVVGIGHSDSRHPRRLTQLDQILDRHSAFQQRMFGVDAQMDESGGV